jgi:hypothetical protein
MKSQVFVVMYSAYSDSFVDSVWLDEKDAKKRVEEIGAAYADYSEQEVK